MRDWPTCLTRSATRRMPVQSYQDVQQATTDGLGNISFTFPNRAAQNLAAVATIAILEAGQSGQFTVTSDSGASTWGPWTGCQPFGPVTWAMNGPLQISGTGLLPNTIYTAQTIGYTNNVDLVAPTAPVPTGVTALHGSDTMINMNTEATLISLGSTPITFGGFPTVSWAGMRVSVTLYSGGPVALNATWNDPTNVALMAQRVYTLGPTCQYLEVTQPHLGDLLFLTLFNDSGSPAVVGITATHTSQPVAGYGGPEDVYYWTNAATVNGQIIIAPTAVYGGPASFQCYPPVSPTAWGITIEAQNPTGSWDSLVTINNSNTAAGALPINFIVPARPIRVVAGTAGGTAPFIASLAYDLSRRG